MDERRLVCGYCNNKRIKPLNPDENKCLGCGKILKKLSDYNFEWYYEAANKYIGWLNQSILGPDADYVLKKLKELENENIRFHFEQGMDIRNQLRNLGYTDDKYGNLDDHYMEILNIAYKKVDI